MSAQRVGAPVSLGREAERYRDLFEFAPDALVVVDEDGRITDVNARTELLFGYGRSQLIDRPVEMLVPARFRVDAESHRRVFFADPRSCSMGGGRELVARRADGEEFPVEITLSWARSEGRVFAAIAVRDVTDLRRTAQTLEGRNAELEIANQRKDRFMATLSHEIRTPLTAIIGYAGAMLMELPGPITELQRRQLTTVRSSARMLLSTISGLLDLARVESGRMEVEMRPFSCDDVLADIATTLQAMAHEKGLQLVVEADADRLTALGDRRAIGQILMNFAANAVKFTERGSVTLSATADRDRVTFRVTDTGPGIAPEDRARVFQAFQRGADTDELEGTGLGLFISRRLADLVHVEIGLESEMGVGSCFTLAVGRAEP